MRVMGWLLVACVMIALVKLLIAMLAIALCILLLWGSINRPGETVAILATLAVLSLATSNPAVLIALVGVIVVACLIGKAIER